MSETQYQVHDENRIDLAHHHDDDDDRERDEPETEATERPKTPRDLAMEEIGKKRQEALNRELRHGEDMADDARRSAGLDPLEHQHDAEELEEDPYGSRAGRRERPADPVTAAPARADPQLRTITIDGNQFTVTDEQYTALAGLGARTNIALQQHQQSQRGQPVQSEQPRQQQQQQQIDALTDAEAAGVAERLLYGGKEDVAKTLKDLSNHLVQRTRHESRQMNEAAVQQQRQQIEHQEVTTALTQISTEYPNIWENRVLGELAAVQLGHVRQENQATGRVMNHLDCYREACNRVNEAIGTPSRRDSLNNANAQATTRMESRSSDRSSVLDRKRAAPSQPSAMGRRSTEVSATRVKSGADIVADMRRSRQQTPE